MQLTRVCRPGDASQRPLWVLSVGIERVVSLLLSDSYSEAGEILSQLPHYWVLNTGRHDLEKTSKFSNKTALGVLVAKLVACTVSTIQMQQEGTMKRLDLQN